jgi:hypothetical protein
VKITCPNFVGMGLRLPRQTVRKSTGGDGLPDKTDHARDNSEDDRDKRPVSVGDGTGGPSPQDVLSPLTPPESKEVRLRKRLNETRVFEYFFHQHIVSHHTCRSQGQCHDHTERGCRLYQQ